MYTVYVETHAILYLVKKFRVIQGIKFSLPFSTETGREQGREQDREQGREHGREQGREPGREQGIEQDREQGREQGREPNPSQSIHSTSLKSSFFRSILISRTVPFTRWSPRGFFSIMFTD
jgi:hypothetical protein